jgi:hypothetical protein
MRLNRKEKLRMGGIPQSPVAVEEPALQFDVPPGKFALVGENACDVEARQYGHTFAAVF